MQPIVFLHGIGRDHRTFGALAPRLGARWNPWLLDFRGHGLSPHGPHSGRVVDHARDACAWISGRWTRPAVLYGHSLGAMVAVAVAAAEPDRVAAIVLEDPPFHSMGNGIGGTFWEYYFRGVEELLRTKSQVPLATRLAALPIPTEDGGTVPLSSLRDPASLRFAAECLAAVDPAVFRRLPAGHWLDGFDLPELVRGIRCPVHVLRGERALGSALGDDDAALLETAPGGCRTHRFPGKGHLIHWPDPEPVLSILESIAIIPRQPGEPSR